MGQEGGRDQEVKGLECLSKVLALRVKAGLKQEGDITRLDLSEHKRVSYEDRRWAGAEGRREACQGALTIMRWAQAPEPGQWRWQKGPLWPFMSEVNGLVWWVMK